MSFHVNASLCLIYPEDLTYSVLSRANVNAITVPMLASHSGKTYVGESMVTLMRW